MQKMWYIIHAIRTEIVCVLDYEPAQGERHEVLQMDLGPK